MVLLIALASLVLNVSAGELRPGSVTHTQVVNGANGQNLTPNSVTATTSLTVPGAVVITSTGGITVSGLLGAGSRPAITLINGTSNSSATVQGFSSNTSDSLTPVALFSKNSTSRVGALMSAGVNQVAYGANAEAGVGNVDIAIQPDEGGSPVTRLLVQAGGQVSIPGSLTVAGSSITSSGSGAGILVKTSDAGAKLSLQGASYGNVSSVGGGTLYLDADSGAPIVLRPNSATEAMRIASNGSVGIGTASPAEKLQISSGTIHMDGTGSPTTGGALCLDAGGRIEKCTSAIDASGNCTCP